MFTSKEKVEINKTISAFPIATEISIAKIKGSSVSYYGYVKETKSVKEIENNKSIFEIGSITKLFTSALLSQFVTEQLIDLNEKIDIKLGFPLKDNHEISYKELSTHTSGLPSTLNLLLPVIFGKMDSSPYKDFTEEKLIHYLKYELKLIRRGKVSYSNVGAGLLGYILSKYTHQSYDQLLQQKLLEPLNMTDTTTIRKEIKGKLVTGLDKKGKAAANWDFNILAGAGAGLSSVFDLSKFIIANIEGKYEYLNNQRNCFYARGKQSMGLGWIILKNKIPNVAEAHFHPGGAGGYRSSMVANFNNNSGVVILSNVSGLYLLKGNKIDRLAFKLLSNMK
jgi:CubicO group peptidase (beta-lactamase class C family)